MRQFVQSQQAVAAQDRWLRKQVQIGIDAANAGELLSADEVQAQAWRKATRWTIA